MLLDENAWSSLLGFFFDAKRNDRHLLVSATLVKYENRTKVLIPFQESTDYTSIATNNKFIDLLSGEKFEEFNKDWKYIGEICSHHAIGAFFSGTTEKNILARPGIYFVVGQFNLENRTYKVVGGLVEEDELINDLDCSHYLNLATKPIPNYSKNVWQALSEPKRNSYLDFHTAWHWLKNHPSFFHQHPYKDEGFFDNLDIAVVKVNPETEEIDDNKELNTATRVWLEAGRWEKDDDDEIACHDIALDCGGDTYEEAIIEMARLVRINYGDYSS